MGSAVLVGDAQLWLPELIERARELKVNGGFEKGADLFVFSSITTTITCSIHCLIEADLLYHLLLNRALCV